MVDFEKEILELCQIWIKWRKFEREHERVYTTWISSDKPSWILDLGSRQTGQEKMWKSLNQISSVSAKIDELL